MVVFMSYLNAQMKVEDEVKKKGREEKRKTMDSIMKPIMKEKVISIEEIKKGNEEAEEMIKEIDASLEEELRTLGLTKLR
ncbi:MAG: hypothetical protein PG981_000899 [Wolbachia endosymbiont of Ctenocephalides orientis wCori]|nr:MAG: hypothetical protein PG981_000899 [Wolbachia endosymbiont of Ctenocephalides orientis wCori]